MDVLEILRTRLTPQSFNDKAIEPEILKRVLEAGILSPSAKNRQAWRFIAVCKEKDKEKLAEACFSDERILQAGCVIAGCTTNVQYELPNGQLSYPLDIAFAMSNMALQAECEGLSSCIMGTYDEPTVKNLLTVPHSMRVTLLLAIGYTNEAPPPFKNRLPWDRIVSFDHW